MCFTAAIPVDTLIQTATRLAPYTSRTAATEVSRTTSVPMQETYYPLERLMMGSKLMRLAQGEVMGAGEVGDQTVVGVATDEIQVGPTEQQQQQQQQQPQQQAMAEPVRPRSSDAPIESAAPKVFKPINLDLSGSESEDEDEDMEQIA